MTPDGLATFSGSLLAPSQARGYVRQHGCPDHATLAMETLLLITSELVTNAVRHGQPPIVLRLSCLTSEMRLSITDTGPELPRERGTGAVPGDIGAGPPREEAPGGLGLAIVAKTSREWGTAHLAVGKEVWCRVATADMFG